MQQAERPVVTPQNVQEITNPTERFYALTVLRHFGAYVLLYYECDAVEVFEPTEDGKLLTLVDFLVRSRRDEEERLIEVTRRDLECPHKQAQLAVVIEAGYGKIYHQVDEDMIIEALKADSFQESSKLLFGTVL